MMAAASAANPRETDPLLPRDRESSSSKSIRLEVPLTRCSWPWQRVVVIAIFSGILSCMGEDLLAAPRIRLLESALCNRYYAQNNPSLVPGHGQVPEHLCKIDVLQDELAAVIGGQFFFDSLPAILFPIPYDLLADKYGRKWILVASLIGFTLSYAWVCVVGALNLPLRWVWFSSLFSLIGGGPTVSTYLVTTMVADVVPASSRSTVFFYRYCTDLIADLTIPPLTWYLMSINIWIPLLAATLLQALSCIVCVVLPETAPLPVSIDATEELIPSLDTPSASTNDGIPTASEVDPPFAYLTRNRTIAAFTFTFLLSKVGRQCSNILLQYVSKRYDWSLSQAELLLSLRASVNLILYLVILPVLADVLLKRVATSGIRDLLLARGSSILMILGSVVLALSSTSALMIIGLSIFTLGTGLPHATRSLVTSIAESENSKDTTSDTARLYAMISVAEGVGSLIAALGMSWTLRVGMSLGTQWLGLPFALAASLFALVGIVMFSIKKKTLQMSGLSQ